MIREECEIEVENSTKKPIRKSYVTPDFSAIHPTALLLLVAMNTKLSLARDSSNRTGAFRRQATTQAEAFPR